MTFTPSESALLCAWLVAALILVWLRLKRSNLPLPPGPPADPIIGHLRLYSFAHQRELFHDWAAQYGDIFHLSMLGQTLVVLNSVQVATDLLEKRGTSYSGRPRSPTFELMGWEANVGIFPNGPRWRKHRKMFQEYFSQKQCLTYCADQEREAYVLLKALVHAPQDFLPALRSFALATIVKITYGHEVRSADDIYVKLAEGAMHGAEQAALGISLLDLIPSLRYIPHWVPGFSSLTAVVRRWRPATRGLHDYPLEDVRRQMAAGTAQPSFLVTHLEQLDFTSATPEEVEDIKGAAATNFIAGSDTTWSVIQTFFLAMLLFPEAQRKAQEEIDRVIGPTRLPDSSDRDALLFVECVLQETIRWHPAVPEGVARKSIEDDVYEGMFIPKGAIIVPNALVMSRDERVYRDAERFFPERFLPSPAGYGEPHFSAAFGFGRRMCPGRFFAGNAAWIVIATFLATFNITKATDRDGNVIEPREKFTTGGVIWCVFYSGDPDSSDYSTGRAF